MLSFKPTFSLSSFTFIKRLFSSSSLSAIRVVSSAYLRLLIFLPAIYYVHSAWHIINDQWSSVYFKESPVYLQRQQSYAPNLNGASQWFNGKESACWCRKPRECRFNPWVRKIPGGRKWPPTPVFLPEKIPWTEEPGKLHSPWGRKESDTSEWLSRHTVWGESQD